MGKRHESSPPQSSERASKRPPVKNKKKSMTRIPVGGGMDGGREEVEEVVGEIRPDDVVPEWSLLARVRHCQRVERRSEMLPLAHVATNYHGFSPLKGA